MIKKRINVKRLRNTPFAICEDELIGKGCFGRVVRAYKLDEPSLQLVAKVIPLAEENRESIEAEIKLLKSVPHHENLVNCLKVKVSSSHNFYLIMQFCNEGSFEKYIIDNRYCSEEIVWRFLRDFCRGYQMLYDVHIIHRDIKPENILMHNGKFKIADFGFSRKLHHHSIAQNMSMKGTPLYLAPELYADKVGDSKIDVFSLGTVLYRLAYDGEFPFCKSESSFKTPDTYFKHLQTAELRFPKYPNRSPQLTELITRMLQKQPESRISWKQIFTLKQLKLNQYKSQQQPSKDEFNQLRASIVEINRSSAEIKAVRQPFNHQKSIEEETEELVEFTKYLPSLQLYCLEVYCLRRKVLIELIKHLNTVVKKLTVSAFTNDREEERKLETWSLAVVKSKLSCIYVQGWLYCQHHSDQLATILSKYLSKIEADPYDSAKMQEPSKGLQKESQSDSQAKEKELMQNQPQSDGQEKQAKSIQIQPKSNGSVKEGGQSQPDDQGKDEELIQNQSSPNGQEEENKSMQIQSQSNNDQAKEDESMQSQLQSDDQSKPGSLKTNQRLQRCHIRQVIEQLETGSQAASNQVLQLAKFKVQFQKFKYENLLYDFLTSYTEMSHPIQQETKILVAIMMDIYDGSLKLESMAHIDSQGLIQIHQIELEDAELDKIDYENLSTYGEYLQRINEVKLSDINQGLTKMGLIIQ